MRQRRILLVEDERDIAELVTLHLSDQCGEIVVACDGYEGMRLATSNNWSLIILDLRLPGPDGLEIRDPDDVQSNQVNQTRELSIRPLVR